MRPLVAAMQNLYLWLALPCVSAPRPCLLPRNRLVFGPCAKCKFNLEDATASLRDVADPVLAAFPTEEDTLALLEPYLARGRTFLLWTKKTHAALERSWVAEEAHQRQCRAVVRVRSNVGQTGVFPQRLVGVVHNILDFRANQHFVLATLALVRDA